MTEDVIAELRASDKRPRRTWMTAAELKNLRENIIRCTQRALAKQLLNPSSGEPINYSIVSRWEDGTRPVPLWAARHIRILGEAARHYDRPKDTE